MSVQVKRRREAATFLAGYVGAQGELLVDTTNNRVQVHDGATAGGWPAASLGDLVGRNAVINGTFAINQRVYASGTALAAGVYGHDRWKAGSGGGTYTFSQTVPDTSVTITAGTLVQAVDAPNVYASAYWLSWIGTAQARVWQGASAGAFSSGAPMTIAGVAVNAMLVSGLIIGQIASLEFSPGTLGFVQFEAALPNAGPTRFERRHLGHEMAICQRYYEVCSYLIWSGAVSNGVPFYLSIPMKCSKRTFPTTIFSYIYQNGYFPAAPPSLNQVSIDSLAAQFTANATGPNGIFVFAATMSAEI